MGQHPLSSKAIVPTAKLVDLTSSPSSLIQNGVKTRNGNNGIHHDNDPGSSGSSTSTLTGQRGPIPLTIKQLGMVSHKMSLITIFGHKHRYVAPSKSKLKDAFNFMTLFRRS